MRTYTGENVKIELYQDGDVMAYQMTGQGIAEQVGTSRQSIDGLMDTLLSPIGMAVVDGQIRFVNN